jgi:hypothetical protein
VALTNERGVEDVDRLIAVLGEIIAAGGCVAKEAFRTGRRAVRAGFTGMLKHKPRERPHNTRHTKV